MIEIKLDLDDIDEDHNTSTDVSEATKKANGQQVILDLDELKSEVPGDNALLEQVSEVTGRQTTFDRELLKNALVGILLFIGVSLAGLQLMGPTDDFIENFDLLISSFLDNPETSTKVVKTRTPPPVVDVADEIKSKVDLNDVYTNPYWYIPVTRVPVSDYFNGEMSGVDEEQFRNGLSHEYVYHSYKAMKDLRILRRKGAESVLYDGLLHRKFWTRMEALIGLADYGAKVDLSTVADVLEGVRPSLVKNYFKRMYVKPSKGALLICKQAIRLVGDSARLVILKVFAKQHWRGHKYYLAAATLDPSPKIQKWVINHLESYPLSREELDGYHEAVKRKYLAFDSGTEGGVAAGDIENDSEAAPGPSLAGAVAKEIELLDTDDEDLLPDTPASQLEDDFEEAEVAEAEGGDDDRDGPAEGTAAAEGQEAEEEGEEEAMEEEEEEDDGLMEEERGNGEEAPQEGGEEEAMDVEAEFEGTGIDGD